MTKQEFIDKVDELYPLEKVTLITYNLLYNEKYAEYYIAYMAGEYEWCYDFLEKNPHLLTLEHTPARFKAHAENSVRLAKEF